MLREISRYLSFWRHNRSIENAVSLSYLSSPACTEKGWRALTSFRNYDPHPNLIKNSASARIMLAAYSRPRQINEYVLHAIIQDGSARAIRIILDACARDERIAPKRNIDMGQFMLHLWRNPLPTGAEKLRILLSGAHCTMTSQGIAKVLAPNLPHPFAQRMAFLRVLFESAEVNPKLLPLIAHELRANFQRLLSIELCNHIIFAYDRCPLLSDIVISELERGAPARFCRVARDYVLELIAHHLAKPLIARAQACDLWGSMIARIAQDDPTLELTSKLLKLCPYDNIIEHIPLSKPSILRVQIQMIYCARAK